MRTDDPWTCLLPDGGTIRDPSAPDAARDTGTGDADVVDTGVDANPIDPVDAGDASPADSGCSFEPFCREDTLVSCRVGSVEEDDCALGCDAAAGRCRRLVPSNLPEDTCDRAARAFELVVASGTERVIDTSTDCEVVVPQVGGPELCVHWGRRVVIEEGATLRGEATDPDQNRALVLVAGNEFIVDGFVSVSAIGRGGFFPGAGGASGPGASSAPVGSDSMVLNVPAPAGSFGERGGAGGRGDVPVSMTRGNNALVPLLGGVRGGSVAVESGAAGGGGGGAMQLVGCRHLEVRGVVQAVGAGGMMFAPTANAGGGGGGSGGGVLIEALSLELLGVVSANGGGGASGQVNSASELGRPGSPGTLTLEPAAGGIGGSGAGGRGGSVRAAAQPGTNLGGGGGGVGRIRINTPTPPDLTDATISPAPSVGVVEAR
jgi:hypothetical protein